MLLTLAGTFPADSDKTIAEYEERAVTRFRIIGRDETLDLLLNHIGHIQI